MGTLLEPFGDPLGTLLEPFGDPLGTLLEPFGDLLVGTLWGGPLAGTILRSPVRGALGTISWAPFGEPMVGSPLFSALFGEHFQGLVKSFGGSVEATIKPFKDLDEHVRRAV